MLDRVKLMQELQHISSALFIDLSPTLSRVRYIWEALCNDPVFAYRLQELASARFFPNWVGRLDDVALSKKYTSPYAIVAIDGSQIYPDKHQGTSCALINIGIVMLNYGKTDSLAVCASEPYIMHEQSLAIDIEFSADWINGKRQEFEFRTGYDCLDEMRKKYVDIPLLFMVDGSLIFWHLESKEIEMKHVFLESYLKLLKKFYDQNMLIAGYISLPKGKDLVSLIRSYVQIKEDENLGLQNDECFDYVVDAHIASFFLEWGARTTLFKSNSQITHFYPDYLKPYFFYLNVGHEIARIEIPAWIARDLASVDLIIRLILDQVDKGDGYPICLAEAHEQAVIKGPDRDFFYQLIAKLGFRHQRSFIPSRKSLRKRAIGI